MSNAVATKSQSTDFCIPTSTFRRLAKELVGENNFISGEALRLLQFATEAHVADTMDRAATLAAYGDRTTVYASDLALVQRLAQN